MAHSNTPEELKKIRENEISDLSSIIRKAEEKMRGKVSPKQYDHLRRTITHSRLRIAHLEMRTGLTKPPKGNKPNLTLTQMPFQIRKRRGPKA